jgi:hypothetical protein
MEASGEFSPPSVQDRIRQAAIGHLLDAQSGIWIGGRENLESRSATFMLEIDDPEEKDNLSMVYIRSSNFGLLVAVAKFREDLVATEPEDSYQVTGFMAIHFPDPFSSETVKGDMSPPFDLDEVAEALEDENLEEFNLESLFDEKGPNKALALSGARNKNLQLLVDRAVADNPTHDSKVRRMASGLRRILQF